MTIRCPECGYENRDMYRFCGMCGATLRHETPAEAPASQQPAKPVQEPTRQATTEPASAPRFITEEPSARSVDYLLEDEPPKSHGKLFVTLLLLVVAGGLTVWHWHRDGYPWANPSSPAATSASAPSAQGTNPTAPANSPPASQPAPRAAEESPTKPAPSQSPPVVSSPPASQPAESKPENAAQSSEQPPETASTPASGATDEAKPTENVVTDNATTADASPPAPAAASVPPAPSPKPKPRAKSVVPAAPPLKGDDKLVAEGEKYLYGNGVQEDCDVAQKNLRIAAGHSNARALTLMGAMYFTGHCVARDLPTAYRWFAKALHQDPSNTRVQQDLEMVWRQMTPEEKQLAVKSGG